jgi:chromosome segregation ATPase
MDKVLEVVGAENAQMERQMGTEETKMKFLTEREKQLQQELADAREAVMEEKKETLEKCQSELRAEKETGYVLDMEIETSGEDLGQATKLREEQQRNLETASKKLSAQEDEVEKLKKMTDEELENMEIEMTEKRESMDIKIERIKENINLINGKIKETLLNCEANEIIAAIPPRVRLLAAPLMRRICRSSLLH